MKKNLPIGTVVDYDCPILGEVRGLVRGYRICIETGRPHAVIGLTDFPEVEISGPYSEVKEVTNV